MSTFRIFIHCVVKYAKLVLLAVLSICMLQLQQLKMKKEKNVISQKSQWTCGAIKIIPELNNEFMNSA